MSAHSVYRPSFLACLGVQARVIGAVMMRELHTRYGRDNIGYLWLFAEPMLLASVIGILHSAAGDHGSDIKPLPFAVVGYTTFILFRGIVNRSEGSLEGNAPLLYHRQVTVLDLTIARALIELGGTFLTFVVMMTLLISLGLAEPPARPMMVVAAWGLMLFYCLGHSLIVTAISHDNRTVGRLVHPYTYFMVGLSGAFMPTGWLPHPFREWLTWVPLTSIFELVRYGWFQSANLEYFFGGYVVSVSAVLLWIGLVLVARLKYRIHLA